MKDKSQAEKDRDKAVAWSRAKTALQNFLLASKGVGTDKVQKDGAMAILAFIEGFEGLGLHE